MSYFVKYWSEEKEEKVGPIGQIWRIGNFLDTTARGPWEKK